jgi:hypothetical protein
MLPSVKRILYICLLAAIPTRLAAAVTFNKDIAPILYKNCASCHRPGEVAPFSLLTYNDAAKRAALIANVTARRYMPPWKPEPGYGEFMDNLRLTDQEIQTIAEWAKGGAPEGDAKDQVEAPHFQEGWQLGKPDLIVQMSEAFTIPAEGRDIYRCFVLPLNLPEDRYVSAVEFRPGNRKVLHHSILHTEDPGPDRERDSADPAPGYNCFGGGGGVVGEGGLGGWVPGAAPHFLPENTARLVPQGSDLIIQNHYHPSGKPETDQSTVGIYFAKKAPSKTILTLPIVQRNLSIPAGAANYRVEASFVTPIPLHVIGISPHMHLLGHDMKVTAIRPDGTETPMIWIKDWDFNWQGQYLYSEPMVLPAGTRIQLEAHYDNSSGNPRNPNDPPRTVRWGEQTTDEMSIAFVPVVLSSTAERRRLLTALALQLRNMLPAGRGGIPPALRNFIASPIGMQLLFAQMSEGHETITRPQFRKFISQYPQVPAALFDLLDTNEDGEVSRQEFQQLAQLLGM